MTFYLPARGRLPRLPHVNRGRSLWLQPLGDDRQDLLGLAVADLKKPEWKSQVLILNVSRIQIPRGSTIKIPDGAGIMGSRYSYQPFDRVDSHIAIANASSPAIFPSSKHSLLKLDHLGLTGK